MSNNFFMQCAILWAAALTALCPAQYAEWSLPSTAGETLWLEANGDQMRDLFIFEGRTMTVWFGDESKGFPEQPSLQVRFPDHYACFALDALTTSAVKSVFAMSPEGVDVLRLVAAGQAGPGDSRAAPSQPLTFEPVVRHSTNVSPAPGRIDRVDFLIDFDGDGRAEILLPEKTGFVVLKQQEGRWSPVVEIGGLAPPKIELEAQALGIKHFLGLRTVSTLWTPDARQRVFPQLPKQSFYQFSSSWPLTSLRIADVNKDGRLDLSSSGQIAEQTTTGSFRLTEQDPFATTFLGNGILSGGEFGRGFCDVDGDGRLDMVQVYTEGHSFAPKTRVKVWLDIESEGAEERDPLVFRTGDISPDYRDLTQRVMQDLDNDGDLDLVMIYIDHAYTSAEANLKAFFNRGIKGELRFYLWEKDQGYPKRPAFSFPVLFRYDIFGLPELENLPFRVDHDFDGDGWNDLLIKSGANELSVHRFLGPKQGFATSPWHVFRPPGEVKIDSFEAREISLDGRTDLLVTINDPAHPKQFPVIVFYSTK